MFKRIMFVSTTIALVVASSANATEVPVAVNTGVETGAVVGGAETYSVPVDEGEAVVIDDAGTEIEELDKPKEAKNEGHTANSVYICSGRGKIPICYSKDDCEKEFMNFEIVYDNATGAYQKTLMSDLGGVFPAPVRPTELTTETSPDSISFIVKPVTTTLTVVEIGKKNLRFKESGYTEHLSNVNIPSLILEGKCRRFNVEATDD
ncbi:MAG: hypothetical protein GY804_06320 [Alphaproteobacteria bacterium]|nr:hypothetical protein [Alphaproteobacteria bacterium]